VWRLLIPENELPGFIRDCEQNILPRFKQARGLLVAWLWHRPCVAYADVQIVSIWHSLQEMNQFTSSAACHHVILVIGKSSSYESFVISENRKSVAASDLGNPFILKGKQP